MGERCGHMSRAIYVWIHVREDWIFAFGGRSHRDGRRLSLRFMIEIIISKLPFFFSFSSFSAIVFWAICNQLRDIWDWLGNSWGNSYIPCLYISNNRPSLHLWWKENLVKHRKVSKYCETDCRLIHVVPETLHSLIIEEY